jgi:hypothetical protein
MWFDCLQIASVPSKRTSKLCTHAHHSDGSVAAAIFANETYFVDTPHIIEIEIIIGVSSVIEMCFQFNNDISRFDWLLGFWSWLLECG